MNGPSSFQLGILAALQGRRIYAGTVPEHVKAKRRAANKQARRSRRVSRGR